MDISQIFSQMILLFALITLGYLAAKTGVLSGEARRPMTNLVLYITNPCTILYSVLSGEARLSRGELLLLTAIALIFYLLLMALAQLVPRLLRVPRGQEGIYRFMTVFSNIGFMGFPVVRAVFGQGAVFYAAIFNLFFQFFAYAYGIHQISGEPARKSFFLRTLRQPVIVACLLAYAIYFFSLQEPIAGSRPGQLLTQALGMVNGITSPLCMIITGLGLAEVPFRRVFGAWRLYLLSIGKQVLLPLGAFALLSPLVKNELILGICVIMAAMPVATTSSLFCAKYDGPEDVAASGIFLSTVLSIPAVPLIMTLLF